MSCCGRPSAGTKSVKAIKVFDITGECDVCFGINGDTSAKPVYYCSRCDALICEYCDKKYLRRGIAAVRKKWYKFFKKK